MNFEEMQGAWKNQASPEAPAQAEALNTTLVGRIRRNQRAHTQTLVLAFLTHLIGYGIIIGAIVLEALLGPHTSVRFIRGFAICLLVASVVVVALSAFLLRRAPGMYSIRANRTRSLPDNIHRDARRYRIGMVLGDSQQALYSLLIAGLALTLAIRTGLHGSLRWIAVALPLVPVLDILIRRSLQRSPAPRPEQSLSEVLALSIRSTQIQVRRVKHSWWQGALPTLLGIFLGMEPLWVKHGAIRPLGWILLAFYTVILAVSAAVSRWSVRRLLQPRLAELTQLQADLTGQ